ncbi:recombinase family protein [Aromatoleum bremense]|uniref:Recombinase family protein n=1 Tax=Aromatoleum bremense TaxID=76115 RepID=A0ABX1P0H8_9RHOO|nr:recombinase family protein [Aromatoleum bremense]NMG17407.1 recombinase family protein [Aromatoleum bremense]QTQ33194.1 DNA-binding recombinase domain-containing protein [Aromatoleum bremense]
MNAPVTRKRCAVYCRVSTDERLDQSFNSIDAQREAGQAFIASQRTEGWIPVVDDYDDGGFSGGNMDRPALKRLLADIDAGKVDIVVVYKIDRLTRNLTDFSKMVDLFDQRGVSFSAVTQQINSATSMGRLMLNILLSFAQFEREVTGERIRDKIAASKAKGMWMGGTPPLGYDVNQRQLVINEAEAEIVRGIWQRFVELRSTTELARELNRKGITTKAWTTVDGTFRPGRPITKQNLYKTLRNPLYLGMISHKGKTFPGQHEPILDQALWDQAQAILAVEAGLRASQTMTRHDNESILRGLLFAPNGDRMLPTATKKKTGKRYRYYLPYSDKKLGRGTNPFGIVPAGQIEALVLEQVKSALQSPEMIQSVWDEVQKLDATAQEPFVVLAMRNLSAVWNELFPEERCRLVRLLITKVQLRDDGIDIEWHPTGWSALMKELAPNSIGAELREREMEAMA